MNRRPTLTELDGDHWKDEGRGPYTSSAWDKGRGAVRRAPDQSHLERLRPSPEDLERCLELERCWCGERLNHDWPGRAEGEPHPRSR